MEHNTLGASRTSAIKPFAKVGVVAAGSMASFLLATPVVVVAAVLCVVGRHAVGPSALATWASLSVLRILVSPLLVLVFWLVGWFAPDRSPRLALLAAAFREVAVSACGGFVWILS